MTTDAPVTGLNKSPSDDPLIDRSRQAPAARETKPAIVRYWGSHFKSLSSARFVAAFFRPLARRGWTSYLVLERPPEDPAWLAEFEGLGVNIHYAPRARANFDPACMARTRSFVKRVKPDVFHCENIHTSPLIGAWLGGAPVRIWSKLSMNTAFEECRPPSFKERIGISVRVSCLLSTRVIAVSSQVRGELVERGIPPKKIIVRNSPKALSSRISAAERAEMRRNWKCESDEIVFLTVGHSVPVKGWDLLLKAFAKIAATESRARLVCVGSVTAHAEKQHFQELQSLAQTLGIENKITFTGRMSNVGPALQAADVFAMPSRSEGASIALIEALEAGLPCIVSDVGNAREVIRDGIDGFIVPRCNVEELTKALLIVAQEEDVRRSFIRKVHVPPHIPTLDEAAEQMARDYELLLAHGEPQTFTGGFSM